MILCKVAIDAANHGSAIAAVLYEVLNDGSRRRIPASARLWTDNGAKKRNSALIPSVILYKEKNPGLIAKDFYGFDALQMIKQTDAQLAAAENIKVRLFAEGEPSTEHIRNFTNLVKYLLGCIRFDEDTQPDAYEIWVSHPMTCDKGRFSLLKNILHAALGDLSIPKHSLHFVSETDCAFRFAISDKTIQTAIQNTLTVKDSAIALLCDIGESAMRLGLYRFFRDKKKIWAVPKDILRSEDAAGCVMDHVLLSKLLEMDLLDQSKLKGIPESMQMLRWITPLKEELNHDLAKENNANLNSLEGIAIEEKLMRHEAVDRQQFEQWCSGYVCAVCKQIKHLAEQAGIEPENIDLVILTGGGSELYPIETAIRELLKPGSGDKACVLHPCDPSGILDGKIAADDHPDYFGGLCPKAEISALACVLGNLAEEIDLTMPITQAPVDTASEKKEETQTETPKNVYKVVYSPFKPCPHDGFIATFKRCDNKGYSCDAYRICDPQCTQYTCNCVSECYCDSDCSSDYDCWCEREY